MDTGVDAIRTIYGLLLKYGGEVDDYSRYGNEVWITIIEFANENKRDRNDHDYHLYIFKLSPEDNGLKCHFPVENEMWSHY